MIIREKVRIGDQVVTLETGRIAKQAGGSCLVRAGDTIVLVTACGSQDKKPGQSFFPLSVDYQEKTYAAGKIPGGFFKREGKLRDYEVLTSRLIDRPCRPLFPEGYLSEVQIIATVMSFDQENPPDTLALIGASAALHISQIPWSGPIAGVRVGRIDGEFIANPTYQQMEESDCELLVAASRDAIVMVEGEADEMSEEDMVEALFFAHRAVQDTLDLIERMRQAVGKPKWAFAGDTTPAILRDRVRQVAGFKVREACSIANKGARSDAFKLVRREALEILGPEFPGQEELVKGAFEDLRYNTMRGQVLEEGRRLDGRDTRTVRPISIELGILPRTHGSSLFTRGETQAIVTTTLGTSRDSQRLDTLQGDQHKRFMLHYNFPPYSVGETKPMRGPGRREVGHGNLAERALTKVLPSAEQFPYAIRIVSEITESNGSSSMASVCGGALALMDAGVPITAPVAGVAMGLIKEGDRYAVLTDILGDEDALGDMDFKVCGTDKGVTAIQMDIKIEGLSREILERALSQAREARLHILDKMQRALPAPREELSAYAPRITQIRVKPDQVRTIIGPGGKMIRAIVDQTGASIDVEDDGTVSVSSADSAAVLKALEIIKSLTTDPEIGEIYEGVVKRIEPYGAFLEIMPGKDGLCHISDIDWSHVTSVEDYMKLGDKVPVKLTNIDREGRIRLSRKDAIPEPAGAAASKLNGRAIEAREERTFDRPREERPARDRDETIARPRDLERAERPTRPLERDERVVKPRDLDREREERVAKPRDLDREREERIAKPRDLDREREERIAKPRDLDRERDERVVKPRDLDREREERVVKPRDLDADERLPLRGREDRPARARDLDREPRVARSRDLEREERVAKPRDLDRERDERVVGRELEREERAPLRARDELREERPARGRELARPRDLDRDARAPIKTRELDDELAPTPKSRDLDRVARVRDLDRVAPRIDEERDEREERGRGRDLDRVSARDGREGTGRGARRDLDERPVAKPRDLDERPVAKPRDLDERAVAKPRDFERKEPFAKARELGDERVPARGRDPLREGARARRGELDEALPLKRRELDEPVPVVAKPRDLDERPVRAPRDLDRELPARGRREAAREVERELPRARRELDRELTPRARRDVERDLPALDEEREPLVRSARRDVEERPARLRGRDDERDLAVRPREERELPVRPREERELPVRPREERELPVRPREERELPARAREERGDLAARPRDELRASRRDTELERPRVRREEREDERFAARPARVDSDRPVRGRTSELPARPAKRSERPEERLVDEPPFVERAPLTARERDERVERDRPSRVRARARNRERVREAERERERD